MGALKGNFLLTVAWALVLGSLMLGGICFLFGTDEWRDAYIATHVAFGPVVDTDAPKDPSMQAIGFSLYKIPFSTDSSLPQIALVITNVGLQRDLMDKALESLPKETAFSFSPYASELKKTMDTLRQQGRELMLDLPIQPIDQKDLGPLMLSVSQTPAQNVLQLRKVLGRGASFIGLTITSRNQLSNDIEDVRPMMNQLAVENLILIDASGSARSVLKAEGDLAHVPVVDNTFMLTDDMDNNMMLDELKAATQALRAGRNIVLVVVLSSLSLSRLQTWLMETRNSGLVVPLSFLVERKSV